MLLSTQSSARRLAAAASLAALLGLGTTAQGADSVRQRDPDGKPKQPRSGKITEVSKEKVLLQLTPADKIVEIPANTIDSVSYDSQPIDMGLLPTQARGNNFTNARELIKKLSDAELSPGMKEELSFYRTFVEAKAAMASGKLVEMKKAREMLSDYLKTGLLSWHYYEGVELLGEMCMALAAADVDTLRAGWIQMAIDQSYARLSQAPWDETKIRAAMLRAKAQHLGKNVDAALASYDEAIKLTTGKDADPHVASMALAARVGKAEVTGDKNAEEGIKLILEIVGKADAEDARVQGMSALAIGRCYEKHNNLKEALLNYLKVDVLYYKYEDLHAEALYHLVRLWANPPFNNPQRSAEAASTLRTRYPGNAWTAKLGGG